MSATSLVCLATYKVTPVPVPKLALDKGWGACVGRIGTILEKGAVAGWFLLSKEVYSSSGPEPGAPSEARVMTLT